MSTEVGSAYVSLVPSAKGFASKMQSELAGDMSRAGKQLGSDLGEGIGREGGAKAEGGLRGVLGKGAKLAGGVALGAGVAIGAVLAKGLTDALGQADMTAKLTAQLGLTEQQSAVAGKSAGKLFGQGYGTGIEQVNEGIKSVIENIDGMKNANEDTLTRISGKAVSTAQIFDQDLGGVTRGVSQLMRTGLAPNADAAFDIITKGFQNGADKSGDFLDTLNEYGTQFRKLGIDGTTATGLISQGLKAGARDGDLVADSIKEFSIRAVDGSTTTAAGFKAIGLNAKDMAKQIAAGGPSANKGLGTVLAKLRAIKDPVKQAAAATALFGTQAEDMGKALFALDPSTAAKGLGDVAGAADKANKAFNATPTATIKTFGRTLQQGLVNVIGGAVIPALTRAIPVVSKAFGAISKAISSFTSGLNSGGLTSFFSGLGSVITGKVIPAVSQVVSYFAGKLIPIYTTVGNIIRDQVLPIIGSLAQFFTTKLLPAIVGIYTKVAANLKPVFDAFYGVIQTKVLPAAQLLLAKFREWQPTIQKVIGVVVLVVGKILEFAAAILGKVLPVVIRFAGFLIGQLVKNIVTTITNVAAFIRKLVDFGVGVYNAGVAVVKFVQKVVSWITSLGTTWGKIWTNAKTAVTSAINSAKTTVTNGMSSVLSTIGAIPGKIAATVKNWASAGKKLADNVASGIRSNIGGAATAVVNGISGIPGKIGGYAKSFARAGAGLISSFVGAMKGGAGLVSDIAGNVWGAVKRLINSAIGHINSALSFNINLPLGGSIHIDPPDIPMLAGGGRAYSGTLAMIGEGREPETVLPDSMLRGLLERTAAAAGTPNVRVFIGNTELTDIVRVQVDEAQTAQIRQLAGGRRL